MRPTHALRVGDEAPDFCLAATRPAGGRQQKTVVCLRDYRSQKPVIITFYGAAFTPV